MEPLNVFLFQLVGLAFNIAASVYEDIVFYGLSAFAWVIAGFGAYAVYDVTGNGAWWLIAFLSGFNGGINLGKAFELA